MEDLVTFWATDIGSSQIEDNELDDSTEEFTDLLTTHSRRRIQSSANEYNSPLANSPPYTIQQPLSQLQQQHEPLTSKNHQISQVALMPSVTPIGCRSLRPSDLSLTSLSTVRRKKSPGTNWRLHQATTPSGKSPGTRKSCGLFHGQGQKGLLRTSFSCVNLQSRAGGTTPELPQVLPPEVEEGNVEYKRKLVNPTPERLEHLVTQMKWRLAEGSGEAIYELGVSDEGHLVGLNAQELDQSMTTLRTMAKKLDASISLLGERILESDPGKRAVEILVRKRPQNHNSVVDIRVAVLGSVDAGKSTLISVLTQGQLDNGRGRARLNLFRHLHEIRSGRTSSISVELLGFDAAGRPINHRGGGEGAGGTPQGQDGASVTGGQALAASAVKLVSLIDLAGHHKYQKTTLYGLTSHMPQCAVLVLSANKGLVDTSQYHCALARALDVPVIVVVTKVDMAAPDDAILQVENWLRSLGASQPPLRVTSDEDVVTAASTLYTDRLTPIFCVSCVTGEGLSQLTHFLSLIPTSPVSLSPGERARLLREPAEMWVGQMFDLSNVKGIVLSGILQAGRIHEGDSLRLGPLQDGSFLPVVVHSLQRNRVPHRCVQAGQTGSVAVVLDDTAELTPPPSQPRHRYRSSDSGPSGFTEEEEWWPDLRCVARRGMVLLGCRSSHQDTIQETDAPCSVKRSNRGEACWLLEAEVHHLAGTSPPPPVPMEGVATPLDPVVGEETPPRPPPTFMKGFQTVLHCGNVCQPAKVMSSEAGENGTVRVLFRFLKYPEFVREGRILLFRDGLNKARGIVTRVIGINDAAYTGSASHLENRRKRSIPTSSDANEIVFSNDDGVTISSVPSAKAIEVENGDVIDNTFHSLNRPRQLSPATTEP